jgi:hypothetical protein
MVPARGRNSPIVDFSTVLLPQPLPPMTAKMLPRCTSNDSLRCITLGPNASVKSRTDSSGSAMTLDAQKVGDDGEGCVQRDDTDDADNYGARRGHAHIGGATARLKAGSAARDADEHGEA